ncbi:kinase-like domain-containing protein [Rhizophagus irregularis DAOM 181602=DAOM 197198]|nr:kinase-like domain-containing protein [Rhizophagus irregularis DAOM 181602=DAOM 197198]
MIFGYTNQSQCKKCKRISTITIDIRKIFSGNSVLDDFLLSTRSYQSAITKFADKAKNIDKLFGSLTICDSLKHDIVTDKFMNYIPYSQFTNVKELAEGGFSIVYQATWLDGPKYSGEIAILKIFKNSQDISKYFLNELKSNYHCYDIDLIKTYGFTKDPQLDIYILVMDYAPEGDLHKYLQKNFREIKWKDKLNFLEIIINGLYNIHEENFIHRDFHSGNVLPGLIYKIIDGVRPEITKDTSECYADLMKSCWDPDPKKRPSINEIDDISDKWLQSKSKSDQSFKNQFDQAELIRKELIDSKKFGPEFSEKLHPKAIYTSRSLNSYISKCSSIFSKCSSINFTSNDYISEELKLDIDIESGLNSTWN